MGEHVNQEGITRRDLLRRGAILGGAVVWTTPVVQTLGMGRAFAQSTSPEGGQDISYIAVVCDEFFIKWEDDGGWEEMPGNTPGCDAGDLPPGAPVGDTGFSVKNVSGSCATLVVPAEHTDCTVYVKAGQTCNVYSNLSAGDNLVCSAAS